MPSCATSRGVRARDSWGDHRSACANSPAHQSCQTCHASYPPLAAQQQPVASAAVRSYAEVRQAGHSLQVASRSCTAAAGREAGRGPSEMSGAADTMTARMGCTSAARCQASWTSLQPLDVIRREKPGSLEWVRLALGYHSSSVPLLVDYASARACEQRSRANMRNPPSSSMISESPCLNERSSCSCDQSTRPSWVP